MCIKSSGERLVTSDKCKSPMQMGGSLEPQAGRSAVLTSDFGQRTAGINLARHLSRVTRHWFSLFGILASLLLAGPMARAESAHPPTLEKLGNEVQCTCGGCVAPINECPMLNCAEKAEIRAFITKEITDGKDETTILQDLSLKYGVQVLSAPPAHGFNLAVWVLPPVGLLVGMGVVLVFVRRWKHKPDISPVATPAARDPKILSAVEEEMKSTGMG